MNLSKILITLCLIASPIIGVISPRAFGFIPAALGLIACIEYFLMNKKLPAINKSFLIFIAGFLTIASTSYFWAINPNEVIDRITKLSILIIPSFFLLFIASTTNIVKKNWLNFLPYSLIIASVLLTTETIFNYPLYHLLHDPSTEETVAPAVINRSLVIISFLIWPVLYKLWIEQNKKLMAAVFIAASIAIALGVCQSAMIALIFGAIALLISTQKPKELLYLIGGLTIIGTISSPWIAQALFNLQPEVLINWTGANAAQRIELWDFVSRKALESPWYGWGIEATRYIDDFDSAQIFYSTTQVMHPHNFALQLWIELGVMGALSAALFIYLCAKNLLKLSTKKIPFATACFTAILVVNLVGYSMWQGWLIGIEFLSILLLIEFNKQHKEI